MKRPGGGGADVADDVRRWKRPATEKKVSRKGSLLWQGSSMTPGRLSARAARELSEAFEDRVTKNELPYRVDIDPRRHHHDAEKAPVTPPVVVVVEKPPPSPAPAPTRPKPVVVGQPALFGLESSSHRSTTSCSPLSLWWQLGGPPQLAKTGARRERKVTSEDLLREVRNEKSKTTQAGNQLMEAFESLMP